MRIDHVKQNRAIRSSESSHITRIRARSGELNTWFSLALTRYLRYLSRVLKLSRLRVCAREAIRRGRAEKKRGGGGLDPSKNNSSSNFYFLGKRPSVRFAKRAERNWIHLVQITGCRRLIGGKFTNCIENTSHTQCHWIAILADSPSSTPPCDPGCRRGEGAGGEPGWMDPPPICPANQFLKKKKKKNHAAEFRCRPKPLKIFPLLHQLVTRCRFCNFGDVLTF